MKKLLFLLPVFFVLTACATYHNEALVGTWYLELPGSPYFIAITFEADGMGSRSNGEVIELFEWGTRGERLHIDRLYSVPGEIQNERWNFVQHGTQLAITSRQRAELDFLFNIADRNLHLVGEWWSDYDDLIIRADGTGRRYVMFMDQVEEFTWSTAEGVFNIMFDGIGALNMQHERWAYTLGVEAMIISSQQTDDVFELQYHRAALSPVLVGTWYLALPGSPYFIAKTFYADGTGTRSDGVGLDAFVWRTWQNRLHINMTVPHPEMLTSERWAFERNNTQLIIASLQAEGWIFEYNLSVLDTALAGTWHFWDYHEMLLNADGTGTRRELPTGAVENFTWSTAGGVLNIFNSTWFGIFHERWEYVLDGTDLIIISQQAEGLYLEYFRVN